MLPVDAGRGKFVMTKRSETETKAGAKRDGAKGGFSSTGAPAMLAGEPAADATQAMMTPSSKPVGPAASAPATLAENDVAAAPAPPSPTRDARTATSAPTGAAALPPRQIPPAPGASVGALVAGGGNSIDGAIAKAQDGQVSVPPAKAIDMAGRLYSIGRFDQAERVCRQLIAARPNHADAHNILGVTLHALGRSKEAVAAIRRAVRLAPNASSYLANLGEILRQCAQLEEAEQALNAALSLDPANAQALNNLGIVHYERKDYDAAIALYRRALDANPGMAEALNNLGNALRLAGDAEGATTAYQDALMARENYAEAYNNLGTLLHQDGKYDEAEHALKKAIAITPRYVEAHDNLANLLISQAREVDALRVLGDALAFAPRHAQTLLITSRIQCKRGSYDAAEQAARMVIADDGDNSDAYVALGQLLHETDRFDEAVTCLEAAVARKPDHADARNFLGIALKSTGRLDEARSHILAALELNDKMYGAYANLNDLVDFAKEPALGERIEAILTAAEDPAEEKYLPLHYAYAKVLEDRGQHAAALDHYIVGGRMKRATLSYDESENRAFFQAIKDAFPASIFDAWRARGLVGNPDDRPLFIVGMPRSGSTLVEQILSSHAAVHGAGEVKYLSRAMGALRDRFPMLPKFPAMLDKALPAQMMMIAENYLGQVTAGMAAGSGPQAAAGTIIARISDKLLTNFFFVGLIHLILPNARIIHTRRDPVDTCLSAFTKLFKDDMPHSYDLGELGRYYAQYQALMAHWEAVLPAGVMTTVDYEAVVADTEGEAKRLIEFIGLDWDPACLDFHNSKRAVKTASVAQVRRPIYSSAVKRSKKYGKGLKPLSDAIAQPIDAAITG